MHLLTELPAFRRLCLARALNGFGDGVTITALTLMFAPDGAGAVSAVLLAGALPRLLGPVAGALADRADPRRVMVAACGAGGVCVLVIALVPLPGILLLLLAAGAAVAATCFGPAYRTAVPLLVPAERLPEANAVNGAASQLTVLLGAAAGGVIVALTSPRAALVIDVATFAVAAALLRALPQLRPAQRGGSLLTEVREGLAYAGSHPPVRSLLAGMLVLIGFAGVDSVAMVFLVTDELGGDEAAYGAMSAVFGAGVLAVSLVLVRRSAVDPGRLVLLGAVLSAVCTGVSGLAPSLGVLAAAQVVGGAGNAVVVVGAEGLLQRAVPRTMLGRVGGAYQASIQLAFVLAYAAGGPLLAVVGPREVFLLAAVGSLGALAVLWPAQAARRPAAPVG